MCRTFIVTATGLLLLASTLTGQSVQPPGCYDLDLGPWTPTMEWGDDSIYIAPPPRVFLDTLPGRGIGGAPRDFRLEPAPGALPSIHHFNSWTRIGADTIALVWSTGFSGVTARLGRGATTLTGTAQTGWDTMRQRQTALLVATPVSCDAPLPETRALRYRYPRGVGFMGGDSLLVGAALPESGLSVVRVAERAVRVEAAAAKPFDGASEVVANLNSDGQVRLIRVNYSSDVEFDQLEARLIAFYGKPTSTARAAPRRNGGTTQLTTWSNRLVIIGLYRGSVGEVTGVTITAR